MIAREILNNQLLPLHYQNTGEEAMMLMHDLNVNQMPVIDHEEYVGIISIEEILLLKHLNEPLSAIHKTLRKPHVTENSHLFDVMKAALAYNTKIIPILSEEGNKYLGVISAESCLKSFSELNSIIDEGGILEVIVPFNDFVLSDVVRAIELNDVKVLALYTNIDQAKGIVEITVKTNSNDLAASIASLERYGFEIKGYFHEKEYSEDLKDRYDALIHFLNV
jgi:predicted transcriptional regulator